ncbi:MAG: GntR family transcriptional regulator [Paracoccaceae bacterium]
MQKNSPLDPTQSSDVTLRSLDAYEGNLARRAYAALREAILTLRYKPGEALRKQDICATLGVSRSPVAEAIARLSNEGLVDVVPQSGTFVARFSGRSLAEIIIDEQITELRRNLRLQKVMVEDGDFAEFYRLDGEMHDLIIGFTGFKQLSTIAKTGWVHVDRARQLILPMPGRVAETFQEHCDLVDAIAARDPQTARNAMCAHLGQLMNSLIPLEKTHPELFDPS